MLDRSVFIRELLPQDLKLEIGRLSMEQTMTAASFLASVVGFAHARQMDSSARKTWKSELQGNRPKDLDAPSWLWSSAVELLVAHEEPTYVTVGVMQWDCQVKQSPPGTRVGTA
jgi:uncharacterized protein (DUF2252 family)